MAKYEKRFKGDFNKVVEICRNAVLNGSLSSSMEDQSNIRVNDVDIHVSVYERYSYLGKNRVSLNLTIVAENEDIFLTAITSGGSQAVLFKINTFGEEAFLDTLVPAVESYFRR